MRKLKYILHDLRWLKVLNSPFKPFKVSFYAGKTQVGIPYFLPRKWVKATPELAYKAASDEIEKQEKWNKLNPEHTRKVKLIGELFQEKLKYRFAVPLKVGFSYCGLGWKTKWTSEDFRHEWNPILSFVFFGYQIALTFYSPYHSHYWEPWLYYEYCILTSTLPGAIFASSHDHPKVHSLNSVESLFRITVANYKGREQ